MVTIGQTKQGVEVAMQLPNDFFKKASRSEEVKFLKIWLRGQLNVSKKNERRGFIRVFEGQRTLWTPTTWGKAIIDFFTRARARSVIFMFDCSQNFKTEIILSPKNIKWSKHGARITDSLKSSYYVILSRRSSQIFRLSSCKFNDWLF